MNEREIMEKRMKLQEKLNKRVAFLANKDSEASRLSGQISIYNEWIESYVQKKSKGETKPESQ